MDREYEKLTREGEQLLSVLIRLGAKSKDSAVTDKRLAAETGLPQRDIIDIARHCINAGHLVLATTRAPFGRFLLARDGPLADAYAYADDLDERAVACLARSKDVRITVAKIERSRLPIDSRGQFNMQFAAEEEAREKRIAAFR